MRRWGRGKDVEGGHLGCAADCVGQRKGRGARPSPTPQGQNACLKLLNDALSWCVALEKSRSRDVDEGKSDTGRPARLGGWRE